MLLSQALRTVLRRPRAPVKELAKGRAALAARINEESSARYCPGGYYKVRIGDSFRNGTYTVVNKLGYGQYSTVWLAHDTKSNHHVAMKILTADALDKRHPTFELDILQRITERLDTHRGSEHILQLIDEFKHSGPNGEHLCLIFKAMGPDLAMYRKLFPSVRIPVPLMKRITRQLLLALAFLHHNEIIHADIKPQNILIETPEINEMFSHAPSAAFAPDAIPDPPNDFYLESEQISSGEENLSTAKDVSIRLTDFGTSSWFDNHLTEWIQPPMLRAPEVILGAKWDFRVDIWNLGALIWELVEGKVLFDGTAIPSAPYTAEAHLAQMIAILGDMPQTLLDKGLNVGRYFDDKGKLLVASPFPSCQLEAFSDYPASEDKRDYLAFLRSMLTLAHEERPDASTLLKARWLKD